MRLDLLLQVPHVIFGVSELPFQVEDLYLFRLESALGDANALGEHRHLLHVEGVRRLTDVSQRQLHHVLAVVHRRQEVQIQDGHGDEDLHWGGMHIGGGGQG